MRTQVRTLLICLLAACAFGAILAQGASAALPEWGGCEAAPQGKGKYRDPACIEKVTGAAKKTEGDYEWYSGANFGWVHQREHGLDHAWGIEEDRFEPEAGPTTFETTSGKKIECASSSNNNPIAVNKFELEAPNRVKRIELTFLGCHESTGPGEEGAVCYSPNLGNQQLREKGLVTDQLTPNGEASHGGEAIKGQLVFVKGKGGTEPEVGLALATVHKPGEVYIVEREVENEEEEIEIIKEEVTATGHLFEAICTGPHGIGTVWIGGGKKGKNTIISLIKPVDQMVGEKEPQTAFTQLFKATGGIQEPSALEHGKEEFLYETLEGNIERSGWNSTFTDQPEGPPIEIKARP